MPGNTGQNAIRPLRCFAGGGVVTESGLSSGGGGGGVTGIGKSQGGGAEAGFRIASTSLVAFEKRRARWQRPTNPLSELATVGKIQGRKES